MSVFVDVNIFMYAAGSTHPHKEPSIQLLQRVTEEAIEAVSDVEILQEVLYRYWKRQQLDKGIALVDRIVQVIPTLLPVTKPELLLAKSLLLQHRGIEPRDAVHAAIMLNHGITHLYSYDHHFDDLPGLKRFEP